MKFIKIILSCCLLTVPLFLCQENEYEAVLKELASETISVSTEIDNDLEVTVYRNIDKFIDSVHNDYPLIDDRQLAGFIVEYTKQELPVDCENNIEFILSLDNIHTATEEFTAGNNRHELVKYHLFRGSDIWNSSNGKIRITTSFSYHNTVNGEDIYYIWSTAKWLTIPVSFIEDVFVLGTTAIFDSNYAESGSLSITNHCNNCGSTNVVSRSVTPSSPYYGNLNLEYAFGYPYLRFSDTGHICNNCLSTYTTRTGFQTNYIYRVITASSAMIYSSYGTQILSVTGLSVSFNYNGQPIISGSGTVGISYVVYNARGLSLQH